jgi:hypothetical protein
MAEVFEGQCQCGAATYRVVGESLTLFACHCGECQKQSSSAFGMALWVQPTSVEILSGRLQAWVRETPSGRKMVCKSCPTCGSRLFHQMTDQEAILSIKPGTLKHTARLRPVGHIWRQSAQPWVTFDGQTLTYPANPPSFDALFERWRTSRQAGG